MGLPEIGSVGVLADLPEQRQAASSKPVTHAYDALYGFFRDPSKSRWYLSRITSGERHNLYSVMPISAGGRAGWGLVAEDAVTVSLNAGTVSVAPGLDTDTSDVYWDAGWKETVQDDRILSDRTRIQGSTVEIEYYFCKFKNSSGWFIVSAQEIDDRTVVRHFSAKDGKHYQPKINTNHYDIRFDTSGGKRRIEFTLREVPDVVLLMVSGHDGLGDGDPSESYLHERMGPELDQDLEDAGYYTAVGYYVDHDTATDRPGFDGLQADLAWIRENWYRGRARPVKVVVIAHSHGGVWATAAIRNVSNQGASTWLPINMQVALDHSSYGWGVVGHDDDDAPIGGDPRSQYDLGRYGTCTGASSGLETEQTGVYDLEDIVFPNVKYALEVRTGDSPAGGEHFDEAWNVRLQDSTEGLSCYWSNSSHGEPTYATGTTYPIMLNWMLTRLDD